MYTNMIIFISMSLLCLSLGILYMLPSDFIKITHLLFITFYFTTLYPI